MKALSFILALSSFSLSVAAQEVEPNKNKTTDKQNLMLEKAKPAEPLSKPGIDSTLKRDTVRSRVGRGMILDSLPSIRRSFTQPQNNNNNIGRIPNALPAYEPPQVATMPNAAYNGRISSVRAIPLD